MAIKYIGLDFEASGSNPWDGNVPIQLGISMKEGSELVNYQTLIGGWDWKEFEWNEEAYGVHGIAQETLIGAPPVWAADIDAAAWLINKRGHSGRMWNVCVGWNVAGYDRQFITRWMPNLNRLLSYRNVDLNSLVFALAGQSEGDYKAIKNESKKYAREELERLGVDEGWHDALYDAQAALFSFDYLYDEVIG